MSGAVIDIREDTVLRFKRILGSGILAALLVTAAMAIPAQAGTIKAVCKVNGEVKVSDKDDTAYGVRLIGGSGSFEFTGTAACSGANKGQPFVDTHDVEALGDFDSTICGAGKAVGRVTGLTKKATPPPVGSKSNLEPAVEGKKFALEFFVGGEGAFLWKAEDYDKPSPVPKTLTSPKTEEKAQWDAAGTIDLKASPNKQMQPLPPPGDNCAKAFKITGEILVHSD